MQEGWFSKITRIINNLIKFEIYLHAIVQELLQSYPSSATDTRYMTLEI